MFFKNFSLLALILGISALSQCGANVSAQPVVYGESASNVQFVQPKNHYVSSGDNTWDLSKKIFYNGYRWRDIAEMNPWLENGKLRQKWYDTATKMWYCELFPGEVISLGYHEVNPDVVVKSQIERSVLVQPEDNNTDFPWWIFWVLVITAIVYLLWRKRKAEANPETSGAPQVEGGVNDDGAVNRAQNIVARNAGANLRFLTVTNIERGRLYGKARTFYADKPNGQTKRFNGEIGYRGQVHRGDNDQTETVYFLQACGNDVRQGAYMEGLRFVADEKQPEVFVEHNLSAQQPQRQSGDPIPAPFNWKQEFFNTVNKAVEKNSKIYFEVTSGDSKVKFDSLNTPQKGGSGQRVEKKS